MIRRLRDIVSGGTSRDSVDAAVGRGMADVLAALDNVIDDDVALRGLYPDLGASAPGPAPGWDPRTAADEAGARIGRPGSATTRARTGRHAPSRRRRLALRSAAGVAAALTAGAVGLVAAGVTGARHDGTDLTAYVVKRVDSALSGAGQGQIAQMTVTTRILMPNGTTVSATAEEWSYRDRWRSVANSPDGHPVYDEGSSAAALYTLVSYPSRTWARKPGLGRPATRGCVSVVAALPSLLQPGLPGTGSSWLPATAAGALRAAISCGTLETDGQQRVDGIEAIKLTSRPDSPVSETIWVSPGTYLPVQVVIRSAGGQPFPWQTADITWLAASPQNLAKLTVPIPAGFHQGPLAKGVSAISVQTPGGQPPGDTRPG